MSSRHKQERAFHNRLFEQGTRDAVSGFYAITKASRASYRECLRANGAGRVAVELGCGRGGQTFFLATIGASVTGIDLSDIAIQQAVERARREQFEGVVFQVMNAESLEFDSSSVDLIYGTGVLHHLDLSQAYAELARTLRPDGCAIFVEPLAHNPLINLYRAITPQLRTEDEHPLLLADLLLAKQYFGDIETHFYHLLSLLAVPFRGSPIFNALVRVLDTADRILFSAVPPARQLAWQVVMVFRQPKKTKLP